MPKVQMKRKWINWNTNPRWYKHEMKESRQFLNKAWSSQKKGNLISGKWSNWWNHWIHQQTFVSIQLSSFYAFLMAMNVAFLSANKKINSQTENHLIEMIKTLGIDIMLLQETSNIETKTKVKLENLIPSTCFINSNRFDKRQQRVDIIVSKSLKGPVRDYNVH